MYTAPSYKAFNTFCNMCEVGLDEDDPIINMETHLIPDDENEDCQEPLHQPEAPDTSSQGVDWSHPPNTPVSFDLDATDRTDLPVVIDDEEDTAVHENPAAEFLRWHHKLNHMSAAKMQSMAKRGLLPKKLAKCQVPTCTSCLYGKATRRPWRTKPKGGQQGGKLQQPQSRDSASASISWSPVLQGSLPKSRVGSPRKGTRWQQSLWITSVVCPTSTFRSQPMQMKLLKQSWPLRDAIWPEIAQVGGQSSHGIYLGISMQHARSVALVLNLKTGHVSPQFHVTFDPKFETVRQSLGNLSPPSEWQKLCGFKASSPSRLQGIKQSAQAQGLQRDVPFMEFDLEPGESVNEGEAQASQTPLPVSEGEQGEELPVQFRRSPRLNKIPGAASTKVSDEPSSKAGSKVFDVWHNFEAKLEDKLPYYVAFEAIKEWMDIEGEQHPMLAFAASADPDTMYYHEAMREPDRAEFIKAMEKEVKSHTAKFGSWSQGHQSLQEPRFFQQCGP
ncbi:hypothetical protein MHU86_4875 [Fragilaria crotonensis]|nr:hypothetical protein MHU86_4875 [Fragilaria crotonensis]